MAGTASKQARDRAAVARLGAAVLAAAAVVAALIALSEGDAGTAAAPSPGEPLRQPAAVETRFAGIPQDGIALGDPAAPLTMVEFADLQCPFCARYDRDVLPELVDRYVRSGRLRLELRVLAFIGPDSERAARLAAAAAMQDRLWQAVDLVFHNQGAENSGWFTPALERRLARSLTGLDAAEALRAARSPAADRTLSAAAAAATRAGIRATPSFLIGPTGGRLAPLRPAALEPGAFTAPIDRLLGSP